MREITVYAVIAGYGCYSDRNEDLLGIFLSVEDAEFFVMNDAEEFWEDFAIFEATIGQEPKRVRSYARPTVTPHPLSIRRGTPVLISS